jgi:tRNA1(Val) A37 N6-methylase TrmN6
MVQHDAAGIPGLVLLECRRGGKPGLRAEPALLLYGPDGRETAEHRRAYFREEEQAL